MLLPLLFSTTTGFYIVPTLALPLSQQKTHGPGISARLLPTIRVGCTVTCKKTKATLANTSVSCKTLIQEESTLNRVRAHCQGEAVRRLAVPWRHRPSAACEHGARL